MGLDGAHGRNTRDVGEWWKETLFVDSTDIGLSYDLVEELLSLTQCVNRNIESRVVDGPCIDRKSFIIDAFLHKFIILELNYFETPFFIINIS